MEIKNEWCPHCGCVYVKTSKHTFDPYTNSTITLLQCSEEHTWRAD